MPLTSPSDHGMSMNSISLAIPTDAIDHMANVTIPMKAARGVRCPGFSARQARSVSARFRVTSHVPATTRVRPT